VAEGRDRVPTIGHLLQEVEQVRRRHGGTAQVDYAKDGHPTQISLDPFKSAADDGTTYIITEYEHLD
jgi:hypothetical protein